MEFVRLSISIEHSLAGRLEALIGRHGYENRSAFIRDLIRSRLVEEEWEKDQEALGTLTLVYDHHQRLLNEKLTDIQHHHHAHVLAATHIHLDERLCAEMIMVRGRASEIRRLNDEMGQQKGVLHTTLSMGSTGKKLA